MFVRPCVDKLESGAERPREARAVIARNRQAAALFRSVQRERGNDRMSSRLHALREARDIGGTVFLLSEKVERRAIVPDVVGLHRLPGRRVRNDPVNAIGAPLQPPLGGLQRCA